MASSIKKVTEQYGLFKSERNNVLGLWFRWIKDAEVMSASKSVINQLLKRQQEANESIYQAHYDAIALNAFSVDPNTFGDTKEHGGYIITFKWNKLIARKFPELFPNNSILNFLPYSGIGQQSLKILQEVVKPRGLSNDRDVDFLKVVCTKCYHVLDNQLVSSLIMRELTEMMGATVIHVGQPVENCCPVCKHTEVVVGMVNLTDKESVQLRSSSRMPSETASELRDPKFDFVSIFDIWDKEEGKTVYTGNAKIEKFIETENKNSSNQPVYKQSSSIPQSGTDTKPKGCLLFCLAIILPVLYFIASQ